MTRDETQIQADHDFLLMQFERNLVPPEYRESVKSMLNVLCWVLRHKQGMTFGELFHNHYLELKREGLKFGPDIDFPIGQVLTFTPGESDDHATV